MGILTGIKVLDMSRVFAAPLATQMLADLGAQVWKVESFQGDDSRRWGDHVFNAFNRGKKSLAVNLKDERAQRLVRRMADRADVLVENFKTGDMERYGLSYPSLSTTNPRLVYVSLTGFGQNGPRRRQPGYDTIIQAMTGVMNSTGDPDGPPTRVGIAWVDVMAGLTAAAAVLAALYERRESGKGQHIDLALFDIGLTGLIDVAQDYLQNGNVQQRMGNVTRNLSPAQAFRAADAWMMIAVGNDGQFKRLCEAMGVQALLDDARFSSNLQRVAHREALSEVLIPVLATETRATWIERFIAAGIPTSPIQNAAEALADPQAVARGAVWTIDAPEGSDPIRVLASPLRHMSRTPATATTVPPRLGEHTFDVLANEFDMPAAELDMLERDGAIRGFQPAPEATHEK